jgi:hypothetical protein
MKFNVEYVKKNPVMFGAIFIVFGVFIWLYLNRGASSSANTVVQTGPTDAQLAAQTQLGIAQIGANAQTAQANAQIAALAQQGQNDIGLAQISRDVALAQITADATSTHEGTQATLSATMASILAQQQMNADNNSFQLDYAKATYDASQHQLDAQIGLQKQLSQDQLKAYQTGSLLAAVGQAPEIDRDNLIALITGATTGTPVDYYQSGTYKGNPKVEHVTYNPSNATANSNTVGATTSTNSANG